MEAVNELDKHRKDFCRSRYKCAYVIQTLKYEMNGRSAGTEKAEALARAFVS